VSAYCRTLTLADYPDARALYEVLAAGRSIPPFEEGLDGFADLIRHDGTWIIGAEAEGRIVSMATLHVLPNMTYEMRPYALVENVATLTAYQRAGYGRSVMLAVLRKAWAEDAYKVMLLTDRERGAYPFYEKLGFMLDEKHGMILRREEAPG
jgi:GNAT superfamily N-acetyltransferase